MNSPKAVVSENRVRKPCRNRPRLDLSQPFGVVVLFMYAKIQFACFWLMPLRTTSHNHVQRRVKVAGLTDRTQDIRAGLISALLSLVLLSLPSCASLQQEQQHIFAFVCML